MIKNWRGVLGLGALALCISAGAIAGGSGGGPGPFGPRPGGVYNNHFELADGESYFLPGKVVIDFTGQPFFEVDLKEVTWLANSTRKASPYYGLLGSVEFWKKYENQSVKMLCVAHSKIVMGDGNIPQYQISLELASGHAVLSH